MRKNIQLECIIYRKVEKNYEFLLLKRIPSKGGFWQPCTGGLESDDAGLLQGAYREIKEETGISPDQIINVIEDVHYFVMDKHYLTGEPIPKIEEHCFGFEVGLRVEVSINNNIYVEHEEFRWVGIEDALKMLKWENNKDAFKKLMRLLI